VSIDSSIVPRVDRARHLVLVDDPCLPPPFVHHQFVVPSTLVSIVEFVDTGQGVPDGRISLSLRLTFRAPDRTTTTRQSATNRIVDAPAPRTGANSDDFGAGPGPGQPASSMYGAYLSRES
jgi:hypothetical protein